MASVNKKFAVEKGLEVGDDALVVDADGRKTGIGKTDPKFGLDVALTANFDGIVAAESVGIGSTQPAQDFDINKDTIIRKKLFDSNASEGTNGQALISIGTGVSFSSLADISTNAADGTKTVQFKKADGKFGGAENFVYDSANNRVGIGSTIPEYLLQVSGGQVHIESQLLDSNKTVGAANSVLASNASGKTVWEPKGSEITNIIFVTENGNDSNNGLSPGTAKRTVGGATSIAVAGNNIRVAAGIYQENNPVFIPRNVTIDGDDMRNTQIIPTNTGKDLFHVNNGTLIQNLSFVGAANTGSII